MFIKKEKFRMFEIGKLIFFESPGQSDTPVEKIEKPTTKSLNQLKEKIELTAIESDKKNIERSLKVEKILALLENKQPPPKLSELLQVIDGKANLVPDAEYEIQKEAIIKFINKAINNHIEEQKTKGQEIKGEYKVMDLKKQTKNDSKYLPDTNEIIFGVTDYTGSINGILQKNFELYRRNDGKIVILVRSLDKKGQEEGDDIPMRTPIEDDYKHLGRALIQVENVTRTAFGEVTIIKQ